MPSAPPTTSRVRLTAGRIADFTCPPDKSQAFLWDTDIPSLALRASPTGRKTYVFEARLRGATIRIPIGTTSEWPLPKARSRAQGYKMQVDDGVDPRQIARDTLAAEQAKRDAVDRQTVTVSDAWAVYLAERRPLWSDHHYDDHVKLAQPGGDVRKNRKGVKTEPGPLAQLMPMLLRDLDAAVVQAWAARETPKRPARVRLALRVLKAFVRWCAAEPAYADVTRATAASGVKTREMVGKSKPKDDHLQREQLRPWFAAVRGIKNPVIAAYLQCLLLTGARRQELGKLRWEDVNFEWRSICMHDKMGDSRMVPLTPHVADLLSRLPRANQWVFSSVRFVAPLGGGPGEWRNVSKSGRLTEPSIAHRQACAVAGLGQLSLHGLRRSFASLCEWIEVPGGISAQIQGHAPQGVREQNYIRRPLDLLRSWHEKIEAWIMDQAGVEVTAPAGHRVAHPAIELAA